MKAPFPWFGGKSRAADAIWQRFGDVANYAEPFAGSLAVLLARPNYSGQTETVNDLDGLLVNFWRACAADSDAVAKWADCPVSEIDLTARHLFLVNAKSGIAERMSADPEHYDAKLAGWWLWGICSWIGGGWCAGDGPWQIGEDGLLTKDAGQGINRQLPHLSWGQGINRKLPHLWGGRGINRKGEAISEMLGPIAERLRNVRITCGEWDRILGPTPLGVGSKCAVFLDPPYSAEDADNDVYGEAYDAGIAHRVREWALVHGSDPRLRIALCGYDEHDMPSDWECYAWVAGGGYSKGKNNKRERIWFSPHCLKPNPTLFS
jgi:hypothetical protein